ncbi:MAG: alpha/beta hydrolase [Chloroflexia bacterium]|nr:alpha/beta hydrolase [Chloroflexia bacterium]
MPQPPASTEAVRRRAIGRAPGDGWPPDRWHGEYLMLDGIRWFARISPGGDPDCLPVLLLHGLVVSGDYFQPVARRLTDTMAVFVPDLPGAGRSGSPPHRWDIADSAAGLARWMEAHGLAGSLLVANSLGCQIVTQLAEDRPDLVARLVLVAPTMDPAAPTVLGQLWRGLRVLPHESPALWAIWIPDLLRAGPWAGLRGLRMALRDDLSARLPRVRQPTLVVGGEDDPIAPPAWVQTVAHLLPNGRAIVIPNAPHAMNYSSAWDLARIIRAFAADEGRCPWRTED